MKKVLLLAVLACMSVVSFSQNSLSTGRTQLNFGVGFSDWGVPLFIGFDHAVSNDVTLGGELSYRSYREYWDQYYYDHSITGISGNANYHFNNLFSIPRNWDLYAGLNLGAYIWSSPDAYDGTHTSGLGLGAQVGGRYFISRKVGLNLEFGGGNAFTNGKFGLTIKL